MFTPRLAELFEPVVISDAATHSIKILRNKRMVAVRQSKPIHVNCSLVTGISSQRDSDLAIDSTTVQLRQTQQLAHDDIRAGNCPNIGLMQRWKLRGFYVAICVEMRNLDWLHHRADGNFPND